MNLSRTILLCIALGAACLASGRQPEDEPDYLDLSIAENIETPAVPAKAKTYVRTAIDQLRRSLIKQGYSVEPARNGEVLEITIPCHELFAPCDTKLKPSGIKRLEALGSLAADPNYKLLIAAHTDNTGDDQYADSVTAARANAVDDLLWQLAGQRNTNTVPYGLGRDEPLHANDTRAGRDANRRVEIYIVPARGLLDLAGVRRK